MIIANESLFSKLSSVNGSIALENSFIYLLSNDLDVKEDGGVLEGSNRMLMLCPSEDLLSQLKQGDINKKKFKKAYIKQLESSESRFLIYTIIRSLNEKHYMPIFVCTDEEFETGYLKIFAKHLEKEFGLKQIKAKKYAAGVEKLWKEAKKVSKKSKKRKKVFRKLVKDAIKENIQISFDGIKKLEKMEKEFAIDRIAILSLQSDDINEMSKKAILASIDAYADFSKKAAKRIKRVVSDLDISKKPERWSKKDAINVVMDVYAAIHNSDVDDKD